MTGAGGKDLLGSDIEIWWPGDERFYQGKVVSYQEGSNLYRVEYKDGDVENLDLGQEHWRFASGFSPLHPDSEEKAAGFKRGVKGAHVRTPGAKKSENQVFTPFVQEGQATPIDAMARFTSDGKDRGTSLEQGASRDSSRPASSEFPKRRGRKRKYTRRSSSENGKNREMSTSFGATLSGKKDESDSSGTKLVEDNDAGVSNVEEKITITSVANDWDNEDEEDTRVTQLLNQSQGTEGEDERGHDRMLRPYSAGASESDASGIATNSAWTESGTDSKKLTKSPAALAVSPLAVKDSDNSSTYYDIEFGGKGCERRASESGIDPSRLRSLGDGIHESGKESWGAVLRTSANKSGEEEQGAVASQSAKGTESSDDYESINTRRVDSRGHEAVVSSKTPSHDDGAQSYDEDVITSLSDSDTYLRKTRKRSRSVSPVHANKRMRSESRDVVLGKLEEFKAKYLNRSKDVQSKVTSGLASLRGMMDAGEEYSTRDVLHAILSHFEKLSTDPLMSIMNEHITFLSEELKDSKTAVQRKFDRLCKESEIVRKEVDDLKGAHRDLKKAFEQQTNRFLEKIPEQISASIAIALKNQAREKYGEREAPNHTGVFASKIAEPPIVFEGTARSRTRSLYRPMENDTSNEFVQNSQAGGALEGAREGDIGPNGHFEARGESDAVGPSLLGICNEQRKSFGGREDRGSRSTERQNRTPALFPAHNGPNLSKSDEQVRDARELEFLGAKSSAKAIVARAVTIWLLETNHDWTSGDQRSWLQETSRNCLNAVVKKSLVRFKEAEQAMEILSLSIGNAVELAWFTCRATPHNLTLARRNYEAWDPPPKDEEWVAEELLLRELHERYCLADCAFTIGDGAKMSTLEIAMEICLHAASDEIYRVIRDDPLMPRKNKWYVCKKLGSQSAYARLKSVPQKEWAVCRVEEGYAESNGVKTETGQENQTEPAVGGNVGPTDISQAAVTVDAQVQT